MRRNIGDQLVKQGGLLLARPVELLRPQDRAAVAVNQLRGDPQGFAQPPDISFHDVIYAVLLPDSPYIDHLPAQAGHGAVGQHAQPAPHRQRGGHVFGNRLAKFLVARIGRAIGERQNAERGAVRMSAARMFGARGGLQHRRKIGALLRRFLLARRRAAFQHAPQIGQKIDPDRCVSFAVPVDQIGRLSQFEHDRALALLDHRGQ